MINPPKNWFDLGGQHYAQFRPEYPAELATWLAGLTPDLDLAVDVGCGTGQFTTLLAQSFKRVLGVDPSQSQIAHATPLANVSYLCAPAEQLPVDNRCASLITAAQAAHWFQLPAFYDEVRRIAKPGAVLALITYGVLTLEAALNARFQQFYTDEIGPHWPPERALVDSGYATLPFPFDEQQAPALHIQHEWTLPQFLGYVSTWSAIRAAREAQGDAILTRFADDLAHAWGDPSTVRPVRWPIHLRLGNL
ncbi:MAG TPA: class I SAM-dependent methyltransferase [Limnobacter sp.]|uniref:class I SAM-dependent methyltransferase n=1 Tax=Limnobacter sp. TaxID=2003368 RepID=UPI002E350543|nr:class I SAM-dependent methyltransferase [Limnobacter sp.]HEX5484436.1 class I SAM-dependent methyltransferase [Limnobacter sp.]